MDRVPRSDNHNHLNIKYLLNTYIKIKFKLFKTHYLIAKKRACCHDLLGAACGGNAGFERPLLKCLL
jgi:hypothetical protein